MLSSSEAAIEGVKKAYFAESRAYPCISLSSFVRDNCFHGVAVKGFTASNRFLYPIEPEANDVPLEGQGCGESVQASCEFNNPLLNGFANSSLS